MEGSIRKLQILLGILGVIAGLFTMVTAILYLMRRIDNLGICMMGMAVCCVLNSCNCWIAVRNSRKKKDE